MSTKEFVEEVLQSLIFLVGFFGLLILGVTLA
jgi:hypothetical protein